MERSHRLDRRPHLSPFHLASYVAIAGGFWLIAVGWRHLHEAAQADRLATNGPYAWVRHLQYRIPLGHDRFRLLQWPTIPTLIMFPVLVYVYARLARTEERAVAEQFGREWDEYTARTSAFVPKIGWLGRTRPKIRFTQDRHDARPALARMILADNRTSHRRCKEAVVNNLASTTAVTSTPVVEASPTTVLSAEGIEKSFRRGIWPMSHRQQVLRGVISL